MSKNCQTLLVFLLSFFSVSHSFLNAQNQIIDYKQLHQQLPIEIDCTKIPSINIVIIDSNQVKFSKTYGKIHAYAKYTTNKNTLFGAASLTKPLFAYLVMRLVQDNKIALDKPLHTYYTYKPLAHEQDYKRITARMILTHTSGLPNWRTNTYGDTLNLKYKPSERFHYSGEGFVFLQKVIEHIMQKNLAWLMKQYIFIPLKMNRSSMTFYQDYNFAYGHDIHMKPKPKFKMLKPNAAYSLHTTAEDYAKFCLELMTPTLLSPATFREMIKPHVLRNKKDTMIAWGLGLGINSIDDKAFFWHWGDNSRFQSFFMLSLKTKRGFVFFTNSANGLKLYKKLIYYVFGNKEIMKTWDELGY